MKKLWNLIVILFPMVVFCQPQGKLFVHSGFVSNQELGYIQFPQNQYYSMDTIDMDDMLIVDDQLLISNGNIYIYDITTLSKIDSILTVSSYLMDYDNNRLVITKTEAPFFEVYDFNTKTLIFSLNTDKIKSQPVDILVDMGKAYLLFDTSLVIVDLNLQDTIVAFSTTQPLWFPAYNQYLINKGNKIYIDVEFATGAPRFSILSLDKSTLQLENVLFYEFVDTPFEPVLVDDKLYMSFFPSHYDIPADSFYYFQNTNMSYPVCYDAISQTVFLYQPSGFKINYFNNSIYSPDVIIPTYMNKAVYYNEGIIGIATLNEKENLINVYPNPACNELNIVLPFEETVNLIRIVATNGDLTLVHPDKKSAQYAVDISQLADGMYFVELQSESHTYKRKFIKTCASK